MAVFEISVAEVEDETQELDLERGVGVTVAFTVWAVWCSFVPAVKGKTKIARDERRRGRGGRGEGEEGGGDVRCKRCRWFEPVGFVEEDGSSGDEPESCEAVLDFGLALAGEESVEHEEQLDL